MLATAMHQNFDTTGEPTERYEVGPARGAYAAVSLSVVIPVRNEVLNVGPLFDEVCAALDGIVEYEVIYVDDGSDDGTFQRLRAMALEHSKLCVVRHPRSCGQSTAVHTGVKVARHPWIATLDGDGQNDPRDIPRLLEAMRQNSCTVKLFCGYRRNRRDTWLKRLSSRVANGVRGRMLKDRTPDTGCGLKLFARETFLALPYFDHMHRFLPALVHRVGGNVLSVEVNHRPRMRGRSNYGLHNRLWVGIVDLFGVMWLMRRTRLPGSIERSRSDEQ